MKLSITITGAVAVALAVGGLSTPAFAATSRPAVCAPGGSISQTTDVSANLLARVTNTCSTTQTIKVTVTVHYTNGMTSTLQQSGTLTAHSTTTRTYSSNGIASLNATASDAGGSTSVSWTAP
jgi:hypothetical protein